LWLLLRHYKIESLPVCAAGGGLIGLAFGPPFLGWSVSAAIASALAGSVSAIVFWIYVGRSSSSQER